MDTSSSELQELRRLVGELTARVFRLEQALEPAPRLGRNRLRPPRRHPRPPAGAAVTRPLPTVHACGRQFHPQKQAERDLESRIGSHWLNRIGIAAVLIGVSYFLKFAFDNNWIGPAGRVAIGLLAGIAIVVWSENFRRRGYAYFPTR